MGSIENRVVAGVELPPVLGSAVVASPRVSGPGLILLTCPARILARKGPRRDDGSKQRLLRWQDCPYYRNRRWPGSSCCAPIREHAPGGSHERPVVSVRIEKVVAPHNRIDGAYANARATRFASGRRDHCR
jgi:hypothetical protein